MAQASPPTASTFALDIAIDGVNVELRTSTGSPVPVLATVKNEAAERLVVDVDGQAAVVAKAPAGARDHFIQLVSVATNKQVQLAWNAVTEDDGYEIYRDGESVAKTSETTWSDLNVIPGSRYVYTVNTSAPMPTEEMAEDVLKAWQNGEIERPRTGISAQRPVELPSDSSPDAAAAVAERVVANAFTVFKGRLIYRTFIPTATAPGFPCVWNPPNAYFGGDNRGIAGNTNRYRTRAEMAFDWGYSTYATHRSINPTYLYDNSGTLLGVQTASVSGINFQNVGMDLTGGGGTVLHSATNPFCSTLGAAIDYTFHGMVARDQYVATRGWHDRAPSHEVFVQLNNESFMQPIYYHVNEGFDCLIPGACGGQKEFWINGFGEL